MGLKLNRMHLPWDRKGQLLWICPECGQINAWNYEDAIRASARVKRDVAVSFGSCFDNVCGNRNCGANIVNSESPINHPCYTHSED